MCTYSIFSSLVMAALYVTAGIKRSVLTGSTLLFFGILLRVGHSLSVCDPVLRECIAMLDISRLVSFTVLLLHPLAHRFFL
ncbi:hypothetical protein BJV78DRAFT_1206012 [Lactifluus subvellereus]|nr:hypothetical protein BJV78DRAFT_1206012 [Lactifluus subvellereus]